MEFTPSVEAMEHRGPHAVRSNAVAVYSYCYAITAPIQLLRRSSLEYEAHPLTLSKDKKHRCESREPLPEKRNFF